MNILYILRIERLFFIFQRYRMFQKFIDLAQSLGEQITASPTPSQQKLIPYTAYVSYEILAFFDQESHVQQWAALLSNFGNIKEEIVFRIVGNTSKIQLFIDIPKQYATFLDNIFYVNYPTSDLKQTPHEHAGFLS